MTEEELDELEIGTQLRFTISKVRVTKVLGGLFRVENVKGVWLPSDIARNHTPLELIRFEESS